MRDAWLASQGLRILRYPAAELPSNLDDVLRQVVAIARERRSLFER